MIKCPICGKEYKQLQLPHMRTHGYSSREEFIRDYPKAKLTSDEYYKSWINSRWSKDNRDKYSELSSKMMKELWKSDEFRSKVSESRWTDENRAKQSEVMKSTVLKLLESEWYRNLRSESTKKQWSNQEFYNMMRNKMLNMWNDPNFISKIGVLKEYKLSNGKIEKFRSSWEFILANILIKNRIKYEYESLQIKYKYNNCIHNYYPDFYLPDYNFVLEVKPKDFINYDINLAKKNYTIKEGYNYKFISEDNLFSDKIIISSTTNEIIIINWNIYNKQESSVGLKKVRSAEHPIL